MTLCRFFSTSALAALVLAALALPVRADSLQDAGKLLRQGQAAQALEQVEAYLASKPKDAQGRFLKGLILTELNKPGEAVSVFQKLTEDYPELPEPYNNLAVIYAQQKQYDKAKEALEMAIRTHPSYATAHENLGDIYARMASLAYDKALQFDSSNASAQTKLSMILDIMGGGRPASGKPAAKPAVVASAGGETKPASSKPVKNPTTEIRTTEVAKPVETGKSVASGPAGADSAAEVTKTIGEWLAAWSRKDVKGYLAHYASDFQTPGGESRQNWEAGRAMRIDKPGTIQVGYENLRVSAESSDKTTASFRQHYKSGSLKSSVNKVVVLVRRDGKWLIQQERVGN